MLHSVRARRRHDVPSRHTRQRQPEVDCLLQMTNANGYLFCLGHTYQEHLGALQACRQPCTAHDCLSSM